MLRRTILTGILAAVLLFVAGAARAGEPPLLVAAASSMTDAITAAAEAFEAETGTAVTLTFAATSTLARQVANGAPAGVFIAANPAWMDEVVKSGAIAPQHVRAVASNRLVLVAGGTGPYQPGEAEVVLRQAWADGARIAVADPDHVPAGIYAAEALRALGLHADIAPLLVRLPNVRAALAFVDRGETALGIVYRTDTRIARNVRVVATFDPVLHSPIRYLAGPVRGSARGAAFVDFLISPAGQAILEAAGFAPSGGMDGNGNG